MVIESQNLIKIYTKTHQIAPFFNIFSGIHVPKPPPPPLAKRTALPCATRHSILNYLFLIFLPPPPPPPAKS